MGEAAESFERCIAIVPDMSKAYQLGGQAMLGAGWEDRAVDLLTRGYTLAAKRGDRMPQTAMGRLLESIGRPIPIVESTAEELVDQLRAAGSFVCQRTGRPGTALDAPPFRGNIGVWISNNISAQTWQEWIGQGTKVINELRLDFSREDHQAVYEQHMHEFLGIDDELVRSLGSGAPVTPASGTTTTPQSRV